MAGESLNRVGVDLEVTGEEPARQAFEHLKGGADQSAAAAAKAEAAWLELDRAIEETFVKSKVSATSPGDQMARGIRSAQGEALTLQRSFQQLSEKNPFKPAAEEAQRLAQDARRLQEQLLALYRSQGQGRPLAEIDRELKEATLQAEALRQELFRLQSAQIARGPQAAESPVVQATRANLARFDQRYSQLSKELDPSGGGAQGMLAALRDEAKSFNAEAEKSGNLLTNLGRRIPGLGSPISSVVRGLFGGLLIVEAVRGVVGLVDQYRELKRADEEARRQLIQSSVDTGANIRQEIEAVNALKETYHGLSQAILDAIEAEARRARHAPVTQQAIEEESKNVDNEVTRRLRGLPDEAISRAALDAAIKRGLRDQEAADKNAPGFFASVFGSLIPSVRERAENRQTEATAAAARKALADLNAGNPQGLTGLSDAEAQARFASVIGKLPSEFTEEEKRLARINALLQEASGAYTTAADAAQTYAQGLDATNKAGGDDARQALADSRAAADQEAADSLRRLEVDKKYKETSKKNQEEFWKDVAEIDQRNEREAEEHLRAYEQTRATLLSARDAAREFLTQAAQAGQDNPLIGLFIRLSTEVEETRKRFMTFGSDFADMMAAVKRAEIEQEIAVARLSSRLSGLRAEQEARRLEQPGPGLLGPEERALSVFGARVGAATGGTQGAITAAALLAGATRVDPAYLARQQFDALARLESQIGSGSLRGGAATGARDALDAAYKSLFSSLPDNLKAQVAREPAFAGIFAGAFGRDADRAQREIKDAIQREQAGARVQEDARELLRAVRGAGGVPDAERLKEILAVTGALSERELTPDLRQARVEALRESARRESGKEADAERRAQKLEQFIDALNAAIKGKGFKVDVPAIGINLNVKDGLQVDQAQVGAAPTTEQVNY